MTKSLSTRVLWRLLFTAFCLFLVLGLFEFYLRSEVTHIVQAEIDKSGGFLEANPEFLVQYTARGRRFVRNAHVLIKNHFLSKQDIRIDTNSLGFRGPELEQPKKGARILFLGDSITVEDYLPFDQIFTSLVQKQLNASNQQGQVAVVNSGIGNIGTEEEVNILEDFAESVAPDTIVLDFYLNDSRPPWGFSGEIGDRGWLRRHSLIAETIYSQLEERRWIEKQGLDRFAWIPAASSLDWKNKPEDLRKLAALARIDWGAAWDGSSWDSVKSNLSRVKDVADKYNAKVLIVGFPVSYQVQSAYVDDLPQQTLKQLADGFGFSFLDLLPALRQHQTEALFYDHCHPTVRGNEIIAEAIGATLKTVEPRS